METAMLITVTIIAFASIAMNAAQWVERKYERRECNQFIADGARLETELKSMTEAYNNEVLHRQWAVGRTKDQSATINTLEDMLKVSNRDWFRQYKQEQHRRKDGGDVR